LFRRYRGQDLISPGSIRGWHIDFASFFERFRQVILPRDFLNYLGIYRKETFIQVFTSNYEEEYVVDDPFLNQVVIEFEFLSGSRERGCYWFFAKTETGFFTPGYYRVTIEDEDGNVVFEKWEYIWNTRYEKYEGEFELKYKKRYRVLLEARAGYRPFGNPAQRIKETYIKGFCLTREVTWLDI